MQLDNVSLFETPQLRVSMHLHLHLSVFANEVLEIVVLVEDWLGDDVVVVDAHGRREGGLGLVRNLRGEKLVSKSENSLKSLNVSGDRIKKSNMQIMCCHL